MFRILFGLIIAISCLSGGSVVVPGDEAYYKSVHNEIEIIYPLSNRSAAEKAADLETKIHQLYAPSFGFELDSRLYVGLLSKRNQIANGFSTQFPFNMQMNYIGGTSHVDYFGSRSWLETLLYHEGAHNYHLNAKKSAVSRALHSVVGNVGVLILPIMLPVFTHPNIMESSFLLEGNSVLNESWHDNGGRLYSGRLKALTMMQAKAGYITPRRQFNATLDFPYSERFYIVGGFFQLYLAERFGLEKTNRYFWNYSASWLWPFRTNTIFRNTFGIGFEEALRDFNAHLQAELDSFRASEAVSVASSQFFTPLNANGNEIFFLTSDALRAPELLRFDKQTKSLQKERGSWGSGKVLLKDGEYLTQHSFPTGVSMIEQGLFDSDGFLHDESGSKLVQGWLKDGRAVYFDVASSFDEPQLYVGDTFYAQVNSSVHIDADDNLYYFVQKGKVRTLYKNKTALFSLNDYYATLCDVGSDGAVYFIANSSVGSSLYRFDGETRRVVQADNIVDARLINGDEVMLATVEADRYSYRIAKMQGRAELPYERRLFFEDKPYFGSVHVRSEAPVKVVEEKPYTAPLDMHYSALYPYVGYDSEAGVVFDLQAVFSDPLLQNSFGVFAQRTYEERTVAGLFYENDATLLEFGLQGYGVLEHNETSPERYFGGGAYVNLPLMRKGYLSGDATLRYALEDLNATRQPLSLSFVVEQTKYFGKSMYANSINRLELYGVRDRNTTLYGGRYDFRHDLPWEFYVGAGAQYTHSDVTTGGEERGVRVSSYEESRDFGDPSTIVMPSLRETRYCKSAAMGELSLKKVINLKKYFFTFPFSLRRESLYTTYRYYELEAFSRLKESYNEVTAGLTLDILGFNKFPVPISFEYIYNDNLPENERIRVLLGVSF